MAEEQAKEQPKVEKSRKRLVGVLVTSVLIAGAGVAGTVLGPRLMAKPAAAVAAHPAEEPAEEHAAADAQEESDDSEASLNSKREPTNPMAFNAIVVDVRDKRQQSHHMKVGITVELPEKFTKEEFEKFSPRGREAAIAYLRSKDFDDLTDPKSFELVHKELSVAVIKAMGKKHVYRVVITDYVAQ